MTTICAIFALEMMIMLPIQFQVKHSSRINALLMIASFGMMESVDSVIGSTIPN